MITKSDLEIGDEGADLIGDEPDVSHQVMVGGGVQDHRVGARPGPEADHFGRGARVAGRRRQVQHDLAGVGWRRG